MDGRMSVRLIGTGAVRVNPNRGGPCYVIETERKRFLVDCGRAAVSNLARAGIPAESIATIFITHLHFDHLCDLPYLILLGWNNGRRIPLRFYGPPGLEHFLEKGVREAYADDIQSRLAHGKDPAGMRWTVNEIEGTGPVCRNTEYAVSAVKTPHANMHNLSYRFEHAGKTAVVTSDTAPDPALIGFCRDADLLISECSGTRAFLETVPWGTWHTWPEALAELVRKAGVNHAVLSHLVIEDWSREADVAEQMAAVVRRGCTARVTVGQDGLRIPVE